MSHSAGPSSSTDSLADRMMSRSTNPAPSSSTDAIAIANIKQIISDCPICTCEFDDSETIRSSCVYCGYEFCISCFRSHMKVESSDEDSAFKPIIVCMNTGCKKIYNIKDIHGIVGTVDPKFLEARKKYIVDVNSGQLRANIEEHARAYRETRKTLSFYPEITAIIEEISDEKYREEIYRRIVNKLNGVNTGTYPSLAVGPSHGRQFTGGIHRNRIRSTYSLHREMAINVIDLLRMEMSRSVTIILHPENYKPKSKELVDYLDGVKKREAILNENRQHILDLINILIQEMYPELLTEIVAQEDQARIERERKRKVRTLYYKCPAENCLGFLSDSYFCSICSIKVCPLCCEKIERTPKNKKVIDEEFSDPTIQNFREERNEKDMVIVTDEKKVELNSLYDHVCVTNSLKSFTTIKNDCKSCPSCKNFIQKLQGCDTMFCTSCHTSFQWSNLEIITDTRFAHNPHRTEYLASRPRVVAEGNCENITLAPAKLYRHYRECTIRYHQYQTVLDFYTFLGEWSNSRRQRQDEGANADFNWLSIHAVGLNSYTTGIVRDSGSNRFPDFITKSTFSAPPAMDGSFMTAMRKSIIIEENNEMRDTMQKKYENYLEFRERLEFHSEQCFQLIENLRIIGEAYVVAASHHPASIMEQIGGIFEIVNFTNKKLYELSVATRLAVPFVNINQRLKIHEGYGNWENIPDGAKITTLSENRSGSQKNSANQSNSRPFNKKLTTFIQCKWMKQAKSLPSGYDSDAEAVEKKTLAFCSSLKKHPRFTKDRGLVSHTSIPAGGPGLREFSRSELSSANNTFAYFYGSQSSPREEVNRPEDYSFFVANESNYMNCLIQASAAHDYPLLNILRRTNDFVVNQPVVVEEKNPTYYYVTKNIYIGSYKRGTVDEINTVTITENGRRVTGLLRGKNGLFEYPVFEVMKYNYQGICRLTSLKSKTIEKPIYVPVFLTGFHYDLSRNGDLYPTQVADVQTAVNDNRMGQRTPQNIPPVSSPFMKISEKCSKWQLSTKVLKTQNIYRATLSSGDDSIGLTPIFGEIFFTVGPTPHLEFPPEITYVSSRSQNRQTGHSPHGTKLSIVDGTLGGTLTTEELVDKIGPAERTITNTAFVSIDEDVVLFEESGIEGSQETYRFITNFTMNRVLYRQGEKPEFNQRYYFNDAIVGNKIKVSE